MTCSTKDGLAALLPTLHLGRDDAEDVGLPRGGENLFSRLIRNPFPRDRPPRERECAEMLCAVLTSAPVLREEVIRWMADRAGARPVACLDRQRLSIDTEQYIGTKRDDLRITGRDKESGALTMLWTIEVKVGAGFHESSRLPTAELAGEAELVHQVANYDAWLSSQEVTGGNKAGFVLSLDREADRALPRDLKCRWTCMTWDELGRAIEPMIESVPLPAEEAVLARHLAGFIREHLWEYDDMTDDPIRFDDLALLRAHAAYGAQTEQRVDSLVARLIPVLEQSGLGKGAIKHQRMLFNSHRRSIIYRSFLVDDGSALPWIDAGIVADGSLRMAIWLETSQRHAKKQAGFAAIRERLGQLEARNPDWKAFPPEQRKWADLVLKAPLEPVFGAQRQVEAFEEFFRKGFEDLVVTGVADALAEACG